MAETKQITISLRKGNPIFLGNGDQSTAQVYALHKKLEWIISTLSALQQGIVDDETRETAVMEACQLFESLTGWRVGVKGQSALIYGSETE